MRPVVGITLCLDDSGRWRSGRDYLYADAAYARAVAEAGGVPVHLPIQEDPAGAAAGIDGLLLPGGDDFPPPAAYPEHVIFEPAPARQLAFDRVLLAGACERRLPILAVCYGMQLLALQHGGRLHYDLSCDLPSADEHRLAEGDGRHPLRVEPGTLLGELLGPGQTAVNSLHHQAVADPGTGLRVCARAADGVIEAVEREGDPFCLGVQWHPEKMDAAHRRALFAGFVRACAAVAASRRG